MTTESSEIQVSNLELKEKLAKFSKLVREKVANCELVKLLEAAPSNAE